MNYTNKIGDRKETIKKKTLLHKYNSLVIVYTRGVLFVFDISNDYDLYI